MPMSLLMDRVATDLASARKAQNKPATLVLGTILSEIKNREIELRRDATEEEVVEVLQRSIKKRRESIEFYTTGGREELASNERAEATLLAQYLPAQVDPSEIRDAVRAAIAAGATNVGAVMGKVMPAFKGRAEGGTITAIVREELAAKG
ncbi:MAG: GatB/YqeY domain-containing protein [Gemmatimonadaceae bacterium]